jgi:SH3 domain-containing YSC84-like protein 1
MSSPCSSCGYVPPAGTKFCPNCGARMALVAGGVAVMMQPQMAPQMQPMQMQPPMPAHMQPMQMQPGSYGAYPQQQQQPPPQAAWGEGVYNGAAIAPPPPVYANAPPAVAMPPAAMPPAVSTNEPAKKAKTKIDVPPAATGEEAASIYKRMLAAVRGANSNNDEVVSAFKRDCKAYGQGELKAKVFHERLGSYFGGAMMVEHMLPQLARLIPDDRMRKKLLKAHARIKEQQQQQQQSSAMERSSSVSSMGSYEDRSRPSSVSDMRGSEASNGTKASASERLSSMTSKLRVQGYSDNPKCSICSAEFDHLKKRRHRCRKCGASVCSLCSPAKMLIPPEQVVVDTKNYDPSHPQRVCTICAPLLHNFQEGMISQYANCHKEPDPHESKTRLHLPYSKSLEQECRNAADIIGNFFRPDFGANSDRSIPVAFLKRAHGLAFLTVIKAGLFISAKAGSGIVIAKMPDGSWSAPSAIGTAGISGGFEAGGEIVEFMIILGSAGAVKVFHRTQVSIGGGLSVAVGPYGRDASAQAAASRGGINANFSYSHSRGLFVGVSLEGAVITSRAEVNSNFYGKQLTPEEILSGNTPRPRAAQCLYDAINDAMAGIARHEASVSAVQAQGCIHCQCQQYVSKNPFSKKCKTCGHQHDR